MCVCVCENAYLNIPHPKRCKPCLYKSERGKEREGEREEEICGGAGQKERRGGGGVVRRRKERFPYSAAVAIATRPTIYTASATVAWRIQSELTPLYSPHKKTHWPCQNHIGLHPHFCFQPGHSLFTWKREAIPSRFKLKPDEYCFNQNKSLVAHELNSELHYPKSQEHHSYVPNGNDSMKWSILRAI